MLSNKGRIHPDFFIFMCRLEAYSLYWKINNSLVKSANIFLLHDYTLKPVAQLSELTRTASNAYCSV